MSREVIYINDDPNKPSYYTLEPVKNQQGEWRTPYVPKAKLDEVLKELEELKKATSLTATGGR